VALYPQFLNVKSRLCRNQARPKLHPLHDRLIDNASDRAAPLEMHRGAKHVRFPFAARHQSVELARLRADEKEPIQIAGVVVKEYRVKRLNCPFDAAL